MTWDCKNIKMISIIKSRPKTLEANCRGLINQAPTGNNVSLRESPDILCQDDEAISLFNKLNRDCFVARLLAMTLVLMSKGRSIRRNTAAAPAHLYDQVLIVALVLMLFFLFAVQSFAGQHDSDPWFAKDKFEHFALSAFYSAGIAKVAHRHFEIDRDRSILIGTAITISLGALKEGVDYKFHKGRASYKDFIWDIAGTLVGTLAADLKL